MLVPGGSGRPRAAVPGFDIGETRAHLHRLNMWDWLRWASVLFIALLLCGGIFSLAIPIFRQDWQLPYKVNGLFALILLFAAYAVYQQLIINRLRNNLTSQMGMAATLEMLRPPNAAEAGHAVQRQYERYHFDHRISIDAVINGIPGTVHGRTSDLSEGGIGAVIPESLRVGDKIAIHLPLGPPAGDMAMQAVVRHSRGFYHGCEFLSLTEQDRAAIRAVCKNAIPMMKYRRDLK
jgi:hypothetical protein